MLRTFFYFAEKLKAMKNLMFLIGIFAASIFYAQAQTEVVIGEEVFSGNWFSDLDEASKEPEKVIYLDLSLQKLKTFPSEILKFTNLEKLYLPYNYYPSIPDEIAVLDKVKELDISGSYYMNHLPIEGLKGMKSLEKIMISDNKLVAGELDKLRKALPGCTIVAD